MENLQMVHHSNEPPFNSCSIGSSAVPYFFFSWWFSSDDELSVTFLFLPTDWRILCIQQWLQNFIRHRISWLLITTFFEEWVPFSNRAFRVILIKCHGWIPLHHADWTPASLGTRNSQNLILCVVIFAGFLVRKCEINAAWTHFNKFPVFGYECPRLQDIVIR